MKILILIILLAAFNDASSQVPETFDAAVSFNSMGTGTPSDAFLKKFFKKYKTYKRLAAYKAAGCGREGEYYILFSIEGMKVSERNVFLKELKQLVSAQNKSNKLKDSHSGSVNIRRKITLSEISHCRSAPAKWKV